MADKRVNIFLKDRVHTEAKVASVLKKTTLNAFLEQAIGDAIQRDQRLLSELTK